MTRDAASYDGIVKHYETCFNAHGDSHQGVDWPNREDAEIRYRVMLDLITSATQPVSLLDFGCGLSHLWDFIQQQGLHHITYSGLDLSKKFVSACRKKYPELTYYCADLLQEEADIPMFDYVIANGLFTEKCDLSYDRMLEYVMELLPIVFSRADKGLAFNVMSTYVDWQRDDLFHVPVEVVTDFVVKKLSRHFVVRNDYGLYEYTVYVYRQPHREITPSPV